MIPQILFQSNKQTILKVELADNVCELEARAGFVTSAIFSSPGIAAEDLQANRVVTPYASVRLAAGKVNKLCKEAGQISTVYCIETAGTLEGKYSKRLQDCKQIYFTDGEYIYELEGVENGANKAYSIAIVIIFPEKSSDRHFHPEVEEIYIVTAGAGRLVVEDQEEKILKPGDLAQIPVGKKHQIFSIGDKPLEMVVTCADAWTSTCGVYG